MNKFFKDLKYLFLSIQEKQLQKKLKKTTKRSFTNKTSKIIFGSAADVTLNTETLRLIELVKSNVKAIVKKVNCNPEELLNYVKAANTPVYKIKNADKLLAFIHEEEGLIYGPSDPGAVRRTESQAAAFEAVHADVRRAGSG